MAVYPWSFHVCWGLKVRLPQPIYIALGANLGSPANSFAEALAILEKNGCEILNVSGLWQSPSWPPDVPAPDYINACAQIEYKKAARSLLELLHHTEAALGRTRAALNAPRPLDLDLLGFRGEVLDMPEIKIPHPRMMNRGFVLFPLSQIAPNWHHPVTKESINHAISRLPLRDVLPMKYLGRFVFPLPA